MFSNHLEKLVPFSSNLKLSFANSLSLEGSKILLFRKGLEVALQILGREFYKNTKKSSLYSQSLLIFIHKTSAVKDHPTLREIRELLRPKSTPTRITIYFYTSSLFVYILEIHRRKFQTQCLMKALWKIITCLLCYGI